MRLTPILRTGLILCLALFGLLTVAITRTDSQSKKTLVSSQTIGSKSVAYQIDLAHTGSSSEPIVPPLIRRWSRDLGGQISYPIIADGKVFVTVTNQTPTGGFVGSSLYALNATSGVTSWGPFNLGGTHPWSGLAYENGRIFALNYDGLLRAFDAA